MSELAGEPPRIGRVPVMFRASLTNGRTSVPFVVRSLPWSAFPHPRAAPAVQFAWA